MDTVKTALYKAVIQIMKPLARILLKHGVSHAEFTELAKHAFIEVADKEFQMSGRKQTSSRVSVLTGINRKEVTRIKKLIDSEQPQAPQSTNRAFRVVNGWLKDQRFLTPAGRVNDLPWDGEGSFTELTKIYSGDLTARVVFDELKRVGCAEKLENGCIHLKTKAYVPHDCPEETFNYVGSSTADLLNTLDHNLQNKINNTRLQLAVCYEDLTRESLPDFKRLTEKESYKLLRLLDHHLAKNDREHNPNVTGTGHIRAGVGIYYFEEEL